MGENNGATINSIVLVNVARGRYSRETARNANWSLICICLHRDHSGVREHDT